MKHKNKTTNRIIALFTIILVVSMTFTISFTLSFSLNSQTVKADEQFGCCELTKTGLLCQETTRGNCQSGFKSGQACSQVTNCKPGTCVPDEGRCMPQKTRQECENINGFWANTPMESIALCQEGCCGINGGIKAEVLQKKECEELAIRLGYNKEDIEFDTSITSQTECFKKYATQDRGCCVLGGGQCEYGIRESCTSLGGDFIPLTGNKYCNEVKDCAAKTHAYYDCGKLPGTEFDIYWFDSQGSQEDPYEECNYPNKICTKYESGEVECKSTSCEVTGKAQEIIEYLDKKGFPKIASGDKSPLVKIIDVDETLLTGQSTCYNFYVGTKMTGEIPSSQEELKKLDLYGRSTGLQNQIIHCRLGDLEIEGLGTDREKLCFVAEQGTQGQHATVHENEWEECTKCGSGGGIFGVGDLFGPFPPMGKILNGLLANYCSVEECNDAGDCVYHEDYPSFFGMSTMIGSCNPKYPPGTSEACSSCGRGGDGLWNVCDESECDSLGDCTFTSRWYDRLAFGIIYSVVATYMTKVNFIPFEFAACTAANLVPGSCNPISLVADRWNRYAKGPIAPFVGMLSFWNNKSTLGRTLGIITTAAGAIGAISTITGLFKK